MEWETRYKRALAGDLRGLPEDLVSAHGDRQSAGWRAASASVLELLAPGFVAAEDSLKLSWLFQNGWADHAGWAAEHQLLRAALRFDVGALLSLRATLELHGEHPSALRLARVVNGWLAVLQGRYEDGVQHLDQLGHSEHTIADAALRSLATAGQGDLERAVEQARNASLAARSSANLAQEYVANLVLLRVRRLSGHRYLAVRIATALSSVCPTTFQTWIDLERVLAGGVRRSREPVPIAVALYDAVDAAVGGDQACFEEAARRATSFPVSTALGREVGAFLSLLHPNWPSSDPVVQAFLRGKTDAWPYGLHAPLNRERPAAYVMLRPDGSVRRLAGSGAGLLAAEEPWVSSLHKQRDRRPLAALATLATSGALSDKVLFSRVYGFEFVPVKHDGVLRVLLHRSRSELGDAGTLARSDDGLYLEANRTLLIADPRCEPELEEHILALLGSGPGRLGAKEIAQRLSLPLRTVQATLAELVEGGVCEVEREGRRVSYRVEDTTFREPTLHRLVPEI